MPDPGVPLVEDCPSLLFASKFADVEALARGNPALLRPSLSDQAQDVLAGSELPCQAVSLVLGGNGFVGAQLVARLSVTPGVEKVYASIRDSGAQGAWDRLEQTWATYGVTVMNRSKIEILPCDPGRPRFGLTRDRYERLSAHVDQVFNCASSTDYSVSYLDLRNDWVIGLLRVLEFCLHLRQKRLSYLGSIGSYLYETAEDFRRADSWWYSGYCQMKWVNAALVGSLARDTAVPVTLFHTPYVLGATTLGRDPGRHYSWWRIIEIARSVGAVWDGPGMDYCPVDKLVEALVANACVRNLMPEIRPVNPQPYDMALLAELMGLDCVPYADFQERTERSVSPRRYQAVLSSNVDALVRKTCRPALYPPSMDLAWGDNRKLYGLYLDKVRLKDVALAPA